MSCEILDIQGCILLNNKERCPYVLSSELLITGIGESVNMDELNGIAGDELMVFHVANFTALDGIRSQISTLACELPACKYVGSRVIWNIIIRNTEEEV